MSASSVDLARHQRPTLVLGLLAGVVGVLVLGYALVLGFSIEATSRAVADSAKGHRIAVPAVVAVVAGLAATLGFRRRWSLVAACVAVAAAVVAVLMSALIPGGTDF